MQVQEKIGSWCSIYSLCQEQRRTFHTHTHTTPPHTAPTPIPILHPATGDVSRQSHATSQRFAALRGRHARCKRDRVTSESFSELQVMNAFVPPAPAQDYVRGAVLQMTGDECAVLLCAEEHERFFSQPPTKP